MTATGIGSKEYAILIVGPFFINGNLNMTAKGTRLNGQAIIQTELLNLKININMIVKKI